jgi:restriction system protein
MSEGTTMFGPKNLYQKIAQLWTLEEALRAPSMLQEKITAHNLIGTKLRHMYGGAADEVSAFAEAEAQLSSAIDRYARIFAKHQPTLSASTIVIADSPKAEGTLVQSTSIIWATIVDELAKDWNRAYQIDSRTWEELVAEAFAKAGYDEVTLTPRSGDLGRDVIAIRKGVGCIKLIGSVKAYKPGHLVKHDDVRALLGVLSGEQDASKGIVTTTSDFAPRIITDPFIKPFLPTRLELMNGQQLREWLLQLNGKHSL